MSYYYTSFYLIDDLKIKIEQLLKPGELNSLDSESREILKLVYRHVDSFEETAKKTLLRTDLENAIFSEILKLRGIVAQIGSVEYTDNLKRQDFQFVKDDVEGLKQRLHSFTCRLKEVEQRSADVIYNFVPEEGEEEQDNSDPAITTEMIGACDVFEQLKHTIMGGYYGYAVTPLVGMPGSGKTTLAKKLFWDILEHFDYGVWIQVGKKYRAKDFARLILAEIDPDSLPGLDDEEAVDEYLKEKLKSEKYFIVLDDVWDRHATYLLDPYMRYERHGLNHPFIHKESGSRILFTSRLQQQSVIGGRMGSAQGVIAMRLLNKEESWDLFCDKLFHCKGLSCPPQLVKAGKKISEKCEGLPLTILTVARLLSQEDNNTPTYWIEVGEKKFHPIFTAAYDEMLKVLLPSFTHLPPLLKLCFLYIGLFPPQYEIPRTKLINLWLADRFLELNININSDRFALDCLEELVSNSLVMVYKKSSLNLSHTVKNCGLHSSLWHLSKKKATETKFALILNSPNDCSFGDGMKGHHRLSIQTNVLFAIKDVHKSVEDNCASAAHSLLCFGPYHKYQVPLFFRLELLRELDALSIRFYEFPMEVLQLVRLTYLALTTNGTIPPSICQLQFLEFFIVDRHQKIKYCRNASYLPAAIWRLSALKHLEVMGRDLPDPHGASLDNLLTLSKVSARSCTEAVLKGVPHLRELYIQIELAPDDDDKLLSCLTHVAHYTVLSSLKCVIVNPDVVPRFVLSPCFNSGLNSVSLSGLNCPWEEMKVFASLPFLVTLKVKKNAFQGSDWEVGERGFCFLLSLVIEDVDMVNWKIGCGAFKKLVNLIIRHCYKLKKIHGKFGHLLSEIEIVDCNPSIIKEIKKTAHEEAIPRVLKVYTSWDEKLKTTYLPRNVSQRFMSRFLNFAWSNINKLENRPSGVILLSIVFSLLWLVIFKLCGFVFLWLLCWFKLFPC